MEKLNENYNFLLLSILIAGWGLGCSSSFANFPVFRGGGEASPFHPWSRYWMRMLCGPWRRVATLSAWANSLAEGASCSRLQSSLHTRRVTGSARQVSDYRRVSREEDALGVRDSQRDLRVHESLVWRRRHCFPLVEELLRAS